jgi:hypothetical protein
VLLTDDLYLGALALARGGELVGVELRGTNGRRVAVFRIEGPDVEAAEREYHRGPALVDIRLLKTEVTRLKNVAFAELRKEERTHAGFERGDRTHQDRQPDRGGAR